MKLLLIPFEETILKTKTVKEFVTDCDAIVHLAAMNRHGDPRLFMTQI